MISGRKSIVISRKKYGRIRPKSRPRSGRFGTTAVEVGAVDFWRPTANTTEYQKLALQISKIAQIFTHFKFEKLLRLGLFILGELKFAVILAHEINNDQTEH